MLIELKGVQFVNKGAELMLEAMLSEIRKRWPNADICMQPRSTASFKDRARVGAYQKVCLRKGSFDCNKLSYFLPKKVRNYLKRAWGLVFEADVDVIFDATGFGYGDQWPVLPLKQAAKEVRRLKKHNKGYIFLPQALGPFERAELRPWAEAAFNNASMVYAREQTSYDAVARLGQSILVKKQPDFTNILSTEPIVVPDEYSNAVMIIPNSKMLSSKNRDIAWKDKYIPILASIIEILQGRGEAVILLNHEGASDQKVCEQINERLNKPVAIINPSSALMIKAIIGQSKFVVCSRFHGCVSALSQSIPCLGTSWSHKYEMLFDEYGISNHLLLPQMDNKELEQQITNMIDNNLSIRESLSSPAETFKNETEIMWRDIHKRLQN